MSNTKHTNVLKNIKEWLGLAENAPIVPETLVADTIAKILERIVKGMALEPSEKAAVLVEIQHLKDLFEVIANKSDVETEADTATETK